MPQMAPLSWLMLFYYFIFLFMIFNSMNFYSIIYINKKYSQSLKKIKLIWKW